jgi:cell wall-associated NlpC family hydrolase
VALSVLASLSGVVATPATPVTPAEAAPATLGSAATAPTPAPRYGSPYYLASPSGAVWPFNGAPDYGSMAGTRLNAQVVGTTLTPDSHGYWLFAGDGGVFTFGDAHFYGSTGNLHLNQPVIGVAATPDDHGYWLFAGDGGVFTFGDAHFYGSTGNLHLNQPIVGLTPTPDGRGYWMVSADGDVFTFGDAHPYGSLAGSGLGQPVARLVTTRSGAGYWEIAHDGDVYPFGSASTQSVPTFALLHTVSSAGDAAMEWAMAQLGKPYQWGGSGPASFDCSGLVMRAWEAAGADIPRVAADQYNFGTHATIAQLRMGDLVFWADNPAQPSSIYHVAMYIGGHHMVNAPYTGQVVRTDWIGGPGFVSLGTRP